jgi:hypothetical protein
MNIRVQAILVAVCIFLILTVAGSSCTPTEPPEQEGEEEYFYLAANLTEQCTVLTDEKGEIESTLSGMIVFRVVSGPQGDLTISLSRLNLVVKGVPTEKGDSGVIGLALAAPEYETAYYPDTGRITTAFDSDLHYELIDQEMGYRQLEPEGENDMFVPYTEEMSGNLTGAFPKDLQAVEGESAYFAGEVELLLDYSSRELGSLMRIKCPIAQWLLWRMTFCEVIRIQPVFIGTGPSDPDRTGTAFDDLMAKADELWDRCGTERCLKFAVLEPIYLDEPAYKVLDDGTEAADLRAEVNEDDAVEVFVVREMSTALACYWGGGASFSSGTAANKIVTCDQQLSVPCPCPVDCQDYCPCGGCGDDESTCGAVNPYHLAHELGHTLDLYHPSDDPNSTADSIMEPSGFCCDNPDVQSAKNCRNAENPLMFASLCISTACSGSPDIDD